MPTAPAPPTVPTAFEALAEALARGDDVDAELVEAIVSGAGRTIRDLADAVRGRVAEVVNHADDRSPL